jgi:peptide/nickel transport system substrate-binding protein
VPAGAVPPGFAGFDKAIPRYKQDIQKAKQLLAESGEKNVTLTAYWDSADNLDYEGAEAAVLQSSLAQIGITVKVTGTTFAQMTKAAASPSTAPSFNFLWHGAITADPVEYLGSYFESKYIGGYNWSFFDNKAFDGYLASANSASTVAQRNSYLAQAQQVIVNQAPALFVAIPEKIEVISSKFKNFVIGPIDYGYDVDFYSLRATGSN